MRFIKDRRVIRSNRMRGHDAWLRVDRDNAMIDSMRLVQVRCEPTTG